MMYAYLIFKKNQKQNKQLWDQSEQKLTFVLMTKSNL